MGLITKLFGTAPEPKGAATRFELLNGYVPHFYNWSGNIYENELVRAAIDAKARHVSKLDVTLTGSAKPSLRARLTAAPNDWQTWSQFLYRLSTILDVTNTAFIVPTFGPAGEISGIYPIYSTDYELVEFAGEPWIRFRFENRETASVELRHVGIMTRYQFKSDYFGENNKSLIPTMDLISIQNQGIKEGVKNGASFRFMATLSNWSAGTDLRKERDKFVRENMEDGGGVLLWPNTYKDIKQLESKSFVASAEQMALIQTNVFNYFGVNEGILQNKAKDEELGAFYDGAIEPFAIQLTDVLSRMLYTQRELKEGNRVSVTANRLQYMSTPSKVSMVKELTSVGGLRVDEIRELFNYEPFGGEEGAFIPVRGEYYNLLTGKESEAESSENSED